MLTTQLNWPQAGQSLQAKRERRACGLPATRRHANRLPTSATHSHTGQEEPASAPPPPPGSEERRQAASSDVPWLSAKQQQSAQARPARRQQLPQRQGQAGRPPQRAPQSLLQPAGQAATQQRAEASSQPPRPQQQPRQQPAGRPGQSQRRQHDGAPPARQQQPQQPRNRRPEQHPGSAPPAAAASQQRRGYLVVVEGLSDMRAVRRAVPGAAVYVLGTATKAGSQQVVQEIAAAASRYQGVIVLTDPDVAGRQARKLLDEGLPGCLHAFLPSTLAAAAAATRYHEAGNVGVEHASPQDIRAALAARRRSDAGRSAFSREDLLRWGLVAKLHARGGQVTARRFLLGAKLGLGDCDGKQLLRQLNRYCFGLEEVQAALQWAEARLAESGGGGSRASVGGDVAPPGS